MKISYIVNVDLNDKQARAVQVYSNALMFHKYLKDDFSCVCIGKDDNIFKSIWVNNIKIESSKIRKLLFHIQSIKYILETDVVYSRNLSILWLAKFFGKKIVWEMHDGLSGTNLKFFNKLSGKLKIVAISNGLNKYLINKYSFNQDNILIAHDGVFLENYDELRNINKIELRKGLNLSHNKTIVMHTGSLYKGRGAELFEAIIKNFPELYFVQVGGNDENIKEWKKYYKEYQNILFVGHQDNSSLIKYQMCADLLFYPITKNTATWWCCSPMKIFEYMATGIPILGSNIGSVGEVLTDKNSIVFDPEDGQTIVDGVKYFLNNKDKSKELANNALNDIENKYKWDLRVENIVEFIK
jgi:glycosyltransferase involved in cell wall biosynthesis